MVRTKNFLSGSECERLIDYFWLNRNSVYTNKLNPNNCILDLGEDRPMDNPLIRTVWDRLNSHCLLGGVEVHWAQMYEWDIDSKMNGHFDFASKHTVYTSIIYLNDDFEGGQTFFEGKEDSVPETGAAIFYDGCKIMHGVKPVKKNKRYTLTAWYRNI